MRERKYVTVFKTVFQDNLQYRFNVISGWLLGLYSLIAPLALWSAIFQGRSEVTGYDFRAMATYMLAITMLDKVLLADGVNYTVSNDIREGRINAFLFKPIDYRFYMFASSLGSRLFNFLIIMIPFSVIAVILTFLGYFTPSALYPNLFFFLITAALAVVLSYLIYFCLGIIAFWMIECNALYITVGTALFFLAGGWFPLDIFTHLQGLFMMLPFQYQLYFPIRVYLGGQSVSTTLLGIGIQCGWIVVMFIFTNWLWKKGLKKYSAVGG